MSRINLEQQRKRAKDLRRAHAAGDAAAIARAAAHLPHRRERPLALSEAQLVVARESGFAGWPALKHHVDGERVIDVVDAVLEAALAGDDAGLRTALAREPAIPRRSIHVAAAIADTAAVTELLAGDPAHASSTGGRRQWTPLLYACCVRTRGGDRAAIAKSLLASGADVDACGNEGGFAVDSVSVFDEATWRPIEGAAARTRDAALVELLLAAGADVRKTSGLVTRAVQSNDPAIARTILAAKPPWYQLIWGLLASVQLDRPEMAKIVLPYAAAHSPNIVENALVEAIRRGCDRAFVELLLGDAPTEDIGRAVHEHAYREAVRCDHRAAIDRLRALGTRDTLRPVDRVIGACVAGERIPAVGPLQLTEDDQRMLSWAVRTGRLDAVPRLLAAGWDPSVIDRDGDTPLHLAVRAGALATIEEIIAAGAKLDARNFDDRTPLELATDEIARRLRAAGAGEPAAAPTDDLTELFERAADAVALGDVETLRELLDDEPALVHARSPRAHRCTLLHYVGANGTESPRQRTPPRAPEIATLLLEREADPNAQCKLYGGGSTTLGLMLTSAHPPAAGLDGELVRALAKHGADIHSVAGTGPIHGAIQYGLTRSVAAFIEAGVSIDSLYIAAAVGRIELIEQMLAAGADINERIYEGGTALHAAAAMNQRAAAEYLLAHGADRSIVDTRWENTPSTAARHFEYDELADLLA